MQDPAAKSNVVSLRKTLDGSHLHNVEEAIQTAIQIKTDLSNDIAEMTMENVVAFLTSYGVLNDHSRVDTRDMIMLENALQAALYRYHGIEHPLHEVTDDVFQFEGDENDETEEENSEES